MSSLAGLAFETISPRDFTVGFSYDWTALYSDIYTEASRQTILGHTFLGLTKLADDLRLPAQLLSRWVSDIERIRRSNFLQREVIAEIEAVFLRGGIPNLLLKGQRTGRLYDEPDLRQCGDIDYYFDSSASLKKALATILYEINCHDGIRRAGHLPADRKPIALVDCRADGSYAIHMGESLIELHPSLPPGIVSVDAVETHPESLVLASALHILRHASTFGVGMRQLCDLAMECRALTRRWDAEAVLSRFEWSLKRYDIRRWWALLETFLGKYLSIPPSWLPFKGRTYRSPDKLWELIARGGNFGFHARTRSALTLVNNFSAMSAVAPRGVWTLYRDLVEKRLIRLVK